ncbi:MAG: peptide-methionine (R)-S-oxide reductase MsrB [Candidatus Pacebacteria bacterium]|nr:peptide-methionine (R)-S-oxide reductase MsrB [Candidatus Paceibacterota bacterium]
MLTYDTILKIIQDGNPAPDRRVEKTDAEWQQILTSEQYRVTRERGTESPMSSKLCHIYEPGIYACVCCHTPLFDSQTKYDSRSGWPSFTAPIKDNVISYLDDSSLLMSRIETACSTCDAHLGHVFPDGPEPGGLRFCINGVALEKIV